MFRTIILPIFKNTRLCVTACGMMHTRCCRPATSWQHRGCIIPQAVTHSLVLLKTGKIIARNMFSWLELLISRYCCICLAVYIIVAAMHVQTGIKFIFLYYNNKITFRLGSFGSIFLSAVYGYKLPSLFRVLKLRILFSLDKCLEDIYQLAFCFRPVLPEHFAICLRC